MGQKKSHSESHSEINFDPPSPLGLGPKMFNFLYYFLLFRQFDLTLTFGEAREIVTNSPKDHIELWPDQIFFFLNWGKKKYALQGQN